MTATIPILFIHGLATRLARCGSGRENVTRDLKLHRPNFKHTKHIDHPPWATFARRRSANRPSPRSVRNRLRKSRLPCATTLSPRTGPFLQRVLLRPRSADARLGCRDKKATAAQNYQRLGLAARLGHAPGGTDKRPAALGELNDERSSRADAAAGSTADVLHIASATARRTAAPQREARVARDPASGAILRVLDDDGGGTAGKPNPLRDPLNELDDSDPEAWCDFAMAPRRSGAAAAGHAVVRRMEAQVRGAARRAPPPMSAWERDYLQCLVEKHGDDFGAMFWDRRLNYMQETEAHLRRRVKRWKVEDGSAS